eukprot:s916_g28.t1
MCQVAGHKYCQGLPGHVCIFGQGGKKAQPNGPSLCVFCDIPRLNAAFHQQADSLAIKKRFSRLHQEARELALSRVQNLGFRDWLQATGVQQNRADEKVAAPRVAHHMHTVIGATEPYTDEKLQELYQRGEAMWAAALAERTVAQYEHQKPNNRCFVSQGQKHVEAVFFFFRSQLDGVGTEA